MKKITLLLFAFVITLNLNAQNDSEIKNSIRINSLSLLSGFYEFQYERVISENSSIKVGFGTGTLRNKSDSDANEDFRDAFGTNSFDNNSKDHIVDGFSINADFRYFFTHKPAPKGLYVSPGIQYLKINEIYSYTDSENRLRTLVENDLSLFNIRGLFGYQFIIGKRVILNPYLGAGIALGNVESSNSRVDGFGTGFSLNAGVDIGIGF